MWAMDPDGDNLVRLTRAFDNPKRFPRGSPDGTRLAFEVTQANRTRIEVIDAESGSLLESVVDFDHDIVCPSWSVVFRAGSRRADGSRRERAGRCSADLGLQGRADRLLDAGPRRRRHDRVSVAIHATTRAVARLPLCPWMRPRRNVLSVHQDRR